MLNNKIILEDLQMILEADVPWEQFRDKTILITGANGFLPAYMVETLLLLNKQGNFNIKILALVRNLKKAQERFQDYKDTKEIQLIVQDVAEKILVDGPVDFIIHAASQASPKYYGSDPVGTLLANVLGTINVMELAAQKKVESVLYFSSGEVYGQVPEELVPIKETTFGYLDPVNVRSCYAESKRMGENICVSWFHQFGIPAKMVRPFHTYGPKMLLDDGRVYADFVANILSGQDLVLNSDGSARRAFCYLADATIAFFLVLLKGEKGQVYNIGNPKEEYSILELAEVLVFIRSDKELKVSKANKSLDGNYLKSPLTRNSPDITKVQALGWLPKITIREGFTRTVASYQY